jgi:hypothetical protein
MTETQSFGPWTDARMPDMSWHDNHVHGVRLVSGSHGCGELLLDIDYIVEWIRGSTGFQFRIVPATLRFREVTNLRVAIDYVGMSAAMGPFSIDGIYRTAEQRERYVARCWRIPVNFPGGEISFEASGFEQVAWGKAVVTPMQLLEPRQRQALEA